MTYTQNDIINLIAILKVGRAKSQKASEIEKQLNQLHGFPITGNQVAARSLISFAIQHGYLIKSSTANPAGYWIENNNEEVMKYVRSLRRRAQKINDRANNLEANLHNG